ncbi:hypothetical protein I312_100115 [Cryptococcus bacillisporus CA1280]|uniref:Uncharacterized protein n=1 Tax=Cryptococcus bacillisporus CA1280 TaxID=1296109 RepID=A0A0D0VRC1_CRYGA|nr:hypothetical protein I312_00709 [Cryptococcus bacillisporus CA1280]
MLCLLRPTMLRATPRLVRPFTSTSWLSQSMPETPLPSSKDPSHPHLFYHPNSTYVSLSFLPHPPVVYGSRTVLGYLPLRDATLDDFREEPRFRKVLNDAVKSGLEQGKATTVQFEAETRPVDGWIHITDERAIPPAGRIGETEDLIGSVFVQGGKIVADTYSPLPTYRLVTTNGVMQLPEGLDKHVIEVLEEIDKEERTQAAADLM